jgi:hypothetical protein
MRKNTKRTKKALGNCLLVSICLLLSSTAAFGQEAKPIVPMHAFEIGLNLSYFDYQEDFGTVDPEWDGFMYGVIGSYTYHNQIMLSTSLEFTYGNLDYDGGVQFDGIAPYKEDAQDWILEWRGLVGYDFTSHRHLITPFIGIGYRYWNDDIEGSFGYEREVKYWYSPIGIKTVSPLSGTSTWGIVAEYDVFWSGEVKSHLSDLLEGLNDPEVDQNSGDGYGLRFSLYFTNDCWFVEPFITYWNIDQSDQATLTLCGEAIGYVYEPENETTTYGLRMGWKF